MTTLLVIWFFLALAITGLLLCALQLQAFDIKCPERDENPFSAAAETWDINRKRGEKEPLKRVSAAEFQMHTTVNS